MFEPIALNLPAYPFKIKHVAGIAYIFDDLRKKFLVLTPEEWVRQHIVQYLIREKNYPRSLIRIEGGLKLNTLQKRTDLLVYNHYGGKLLMVECKAPSVKITQHVFDQIARYNSIHRVNLLLVSNGLQHFCCAMDMKLGTYKFLDELPAYNRNISSM